MSPRDSSNGDLPKKSWRERDAGRNRSKHVSSDPSPAGAARAREQSAGAKAALERAFNDGLVAKLVAVKTGTVPLTAATDQRPELLKKIRITEARADVNKLIDELLGLAADLPNDWEVLTRCLDHNRDEVVRMALDKMDALLAKERPKRAASLAMRLSGLEADTSDDDVRAVAERVRGKLS